MATQIEFRGNVKRSDDAPVIEIDNRGEVAQRVFEAMGGDADLTITFKKRVRSKTNPQLAYFHAVVLPDILAGMEGVGQDELFIELPDFDGLLSGVFKKFPTSLASLRQWLKQEHLKPNPVVDTETGEVLGKRPPSLARLNKDEMGAFIERCTRFAAESLGVKVRLCDSEAALLSLTENIPHEYA